MTVSIKYEILYFTTYIFPQCLPQKHYCLGTGFPILTVVLFVQEIMEAGTDEQIPKGGYFLNIYYGK